MSVECDVVVVGAGNAGLCAALAASDEGARVIVLERAPESERGGNSAFTAGAMRVAYDGVDDLRDLMPHLSDEEVAMTDFGAYSKEAFFADIAKVTEYRSDPDLADLLVTRSLDTLKWMATKGVRFLPIYGRQAFKVDGRFRFWGGLTVETNGGGPGLVDALFSAASAADIDVWYQTRALSLTVDDDGVHGVTVRRDGRTEGIRAGAVILASGGFEANSEWRARYLGRGWDLAKVRGSRFNTGDGIRMALEAGAMPYGNWSGCHAVGWDRNAPEFGDLAVGDGFQKHSYPFGIMLNAHGRRFVDEGADFRNYTYAKYGHVILDQPGQFAWQIFDQSVTHLLRDEYRIRQVTKVTAETLEALVHKLDGVDADAALGTIREFNDSVRTDVAFDPNVLDGRRAELVLPKSNWANPLLEPPFEAYQVTCGITFTFGGLKIDPNGQVTDTEGKTMPGLFACGELVGGLFYFNYPGGSGLTSGSVFGRIAGRSAGASVAAGA
ncbi:MAG TPA: FAD-dependent tricarballylate dehydrogenase TcuA [Acidimicrobiia bacterium]|nr:FAD-dependent tricarballylate dehydrogenase TcuA [Acidimicrobiia bacterium]